MKPLEPRTSLDHGRFLVGRQLGQGSTGQVYEAWDCKRDTAVAVKLLRAPDNEAVYRLKREFRALSAIEHPNLVSLHELVFAEGTWFTVMDLVQGDDFLTWVRGSSPATDGAEWQTLPTEEYLTPAAPDLPPEPSLPIDLARLTDIIAQIVRGLGALHAEGKLHRDIKPANVIVRPTGTAVLVDFSSLWEGDRAPSELSQMTRLEGTAAFMAPEQARGDTPSAASDLYAVGVLLFAGLTGRLPFEGGISQVLESKQRVLAPRPSALVEGIPTTLDQLTHDLLSFVPDDRPTGSEVLARLGRPVSGHAMRGKPRFVGRERGLQRVDALWARVMRHHGALVLVRGTAGIGKSRFVHHAAARIQKRDRPIILRGRCLERETVPFKAFDQLVDALRRRLDRLDESQLDAVLPRDMGALSRAFPSLSSFGDGPTQTLELGDIGDHRNRAFRAFRELLANLSEHRPLLLIVDDVHWADLDSARLFANLLRELRGRRVMWILTARDEETAQSPFLTHLHQGTLLHEIVHESLMLGPLSALDAETMALGLLNPDIAETVSFATQIAMESEGNPYLLTELARHAGQHPQATDEPRRLEDLLASRLETLSEAGGRLARAAALAARPLPLRVLARAVGAEADASSLLVSLDKLHLVRSSTSPLGVMVAAYHTRVASALAAGMTQDARGALHLRIAAAMEHFGWNDPEPLFMHFLHGGDQARAGELAARAARSAADGLAFDRAAELYQAALVLRTWPDDERAVLQQSLGEVLIYAGRGREAAEAFLAAASYCDPHAALTLRRRAGEQLLVSGHIDEGLALFVEVLESVQLSLANSPTSARIGIARNRLCSWFIGVDQPSRSARDIPKIDLQRIDAAWHLSIGLLLVEPLQGRYFHEQNLRMALRAGEPLRMLRALSMELVSAAMDPTPRRKSTGERTRRRAIALATELGTPHARGLVALGEGLGAYVSTEWEHAYRRFRSAEQTVAVGAGGAHFELAAAKLFAAKSLAWRGMLREADADRKRLLAEAEASGNRLIASNLRLDIFPLMLIALGRSDEARRELDYTLTQWQRPGIDYPRFFAMHGQVYLHLHAGRHRDAWELMARAESELATSGLTHLPLNAATYAWLRGLAAVQGALRGDDAMARAAEKLIRSLSASRLPVAHAHAAVLRAALLQRERRDEAAIDVLGDAAGRYGALGMRLHQAACTLRLSTLPGLEPSMAEPSEALQWMRDEGVTDPPRLVHLLAPGRQTAVLEPLFD